MAKPAKTNRIAIPQPAPRVQNPVRESAALADIRRQLGWGLLETARRNGIR